MKTYITINFQHKNENLIVECTNEVGTKRMSHLYSNSECLAIAPQSFSAPLNSD